DASQCNANDGEKDENGEATGCIELTFQLKNEYTKPGLSSDKFAHHRADYGECCGHVETCEDERQCAGEPALHEDLPACRGQRAQKVDPVHVDRLEPGQTGHEDREEGDQTDDGHFGLYAEPHPGHDDGCHCNLRQTLQCGDVRL